jgi:hypothetical protein
MSSAVIFGGYGTFGAHVARELAGSGITLTIAGRDPDRAAAFAHTLGPGARSLAADVTRPDSCRAALQDQQVAVNCAGPFDRFGAALLDACLDAGCHYADIADDRGYLARVRAQDARFRQRNLAAVYGCSSLPALSGALALAARSNAAGAPRHARVTMFIGNDNPKGYAAIRSFIGALGRPIAAPQGTLRGFGDPETVALPEPFGRRTVYNFPGAEYDLFPSHFGIPSVAVKVGFESRLATATFALLARVWGGYGDRTARLFARLGRLAPRRGTSAAVWRTELFFATGSIRQATLLARTDGQRLAALPCSLAVRALCEQTVPAPGAQTAYELLGADSLLRQLVAKGFELHGPLP